MYDFITVDELAAQIAASSTQEEVTGIIVSDKINVTRDYVRDIRNILYIWKRYGYGVAFAKFFPKYKAEKGHVKKGNPDLISVVEGKLQYLKMVKGENDSVWQCLHSRFQTLVNDAISLHRTTDFGVIYVETSSVSDFEKKNSKNFLLYENNKFQKVKAYFKGYLDYKQGKKGRSYE